MEFSHLSRAHHNGLLSPVWLRALSCRASIQNVRRLGICCKRFELLDSGIAWPEDAVLIRTGPFATESSHSKETGWAKQSTIFQDAADAEHHSASMVAIKASDMLPDSDSEADRENRKSNKEYQYCGFCKLRSFDCGSWEPYSNKLRQFKRHMAASH